MLEHPVGQKLLIFAIVMMIVAVYWMRKIIRIDL
jgi:Flp pilus assembly protein TadB